MSLAIWYWLFVVFWGIFGGWFGYQGRAANQFWFGGIGLELILFILLGLRVFGSPVAGH
jgi:hypothetical protein